MIKKKNLLFDELNLIIAVICILFKPFIGNVYFRQNSSNYFTRYFKHFFVLIGFENVDGSFFNKSYILKKFLIKKYLKKNFNEEFFKNFKDFLGIKNQSKIEFLFENYLYDTKILAIDSSSYVYKKKFLNKIELIYFPTELNSYLVFWNNNNPEFRVSSLIIFFVTLKKLIFFLINICNSFFKNIFKFKVKKKNLKTEIKKLNQIGYFPHKGIKYGDLFSKTFLYKKNKNTLIEDLGIDTIFFEETDKITNKFLKFYKLEKKIFTLNLSKNIFNFLIIYTKFFLKNKKNIYHNKAVLFYVFFSFYLKVENFSDLLNNKNYKFFFFYNDYEVPNALLLAAEKNNIRTISFQDRLTSYIYNHRIFFDCYFTCGNTFKKIFLKNYFCQKYLSLSLLRSNLIDQELIKNIDFKNEVLFLKKNLKIISFILNTSDNEYKSNLYGEDGTSIKSLIDLKGVISNLSNKYKKKVFIFVKFKHDGIFNNVHIKNLKEILNKIDNVKVLDDKKITSANLISLSDIIIGKQSTIIEEAIMNNKIAFLYDSENFISTFGFYRKNKFNIFRYSKDLIYAIDKIINKDPIFLESYQVNKNILFKNYLSDNGRIYNFDEFREKIIKYFYEQLKN